MTEEVLDAVRQLGDDLRTLITDERAALEGAVVATAESVQELYRRTDNIAHKLGQVTHSLVLADGALSERLDLIEATLDELFRDTHTNIGELGLRAFRTWNIGHMRYVGEPSATQSAGTGAQQADPRWWERLLHWIYSDTQI